MRYEQQNPVRNEKLFIRLQRVDLSKLKKSSLKRYTKRYNLNVKSDNKQELLQAVTAHFVSMPIRELDVAREFHNYTMSNKGKRGIGENGFVNGTTGSGGR